MKLHLLFLACFLTIAVHGQKAAVAAPEVYTDPQKLFSLTLPPTWQTSRAVRPAGQLSAAGEKSEGAPDLKLSVKEMKISAGFTPAQFAQLMLDNQADYIEGIGLHGASIVSSGKLRLAEKDAVFFVIAGAENSLTGASVKNYYILQMFSGTQIHSLIFSVDKKNFEKQFPVFKEIAAGYQLGTGQKAAPPAL